MRAIGRYEARSRSRVGKRVKNNVAPPSLEGSCALKLGTGVQATRSASVRDYWVILVNRVGLVGSV